MTHDSPAIEIKASATDTPSPEFDRLLRAETFDSAMERLAAHWTGAAPSIEREYGRGIARLYQQCLEPFLASQHLRIHAILGRDVRGRGEGIAIRPHFETLLLGDNHNRLPISATYYVESPKGRRLVIVVSNDYPPEVKFSFSGDGAQQFVEDFHSFTREQNYLRQRAFNVHADLLDINSISISEVVLTEEQAKTIKRHIIDYARRMPDLAARARRIQRGVLLEGTYGTGKTRLLRALITELKGLSVCYVDPKQVDEVGGFEGVRDLAELTAPVVMLCEEVDFVGEDRNTAPRASLATWMQMLDGLRTVPGVLTVATTNRPEVLEKALAARPGRFDRRIRFGPLPDPERARLIEVLAGSYQLTPGAKALILKESDGFTGAQVNEIIETSGLVMQEQDQTSNIIDIHHVREALQDCGFSARRRIGFASTACSHL